MSDTTAAKRETERKYETDDNRQLPDPGRLLGLDAGTAAQEQRLEATYFDTADLRLMRSGVTLRRREGGHDEGWHLKLPAGGDSRDEIQLPLTDTRLRPPAQLLAYTRLHTRGAALTPVAQLNTHRRRWVLADRQGRELAELVEDEVHAHTLGAQTTATSWREIEVELGEQGKLELLDRVEAELIKAGARRSTSRSKLARVLAERLPPEKPAEPPKRARVKGAKPGSAGAALSDYLRTQAEQIRAHDALVRREAPDAVHQMRVASRRMRSALQAYRRVIDREATAELVEELKWLGTQMAQARDSEVLDEHLSAQIAGLPAELVLGPVAGHMSRVLARRRAQGREQAIAALDSDRYLRLHGRIEALLATPPLTRRAARPAERELPASVATAFARMAARMSAVDGAAAGEARDVALHETRKAAKRLRYAVEVAEPVIGKPAKRLRRELKAVQELLGEHQDAAVARPVLRELAAQAHLEGGNGFTHGVLYMLENQRAEQGEQQLPRAWRRLRRAKNTRWLRR